MVDDTDSLDRFDPTRRDALRRLAAGVGGMATFPRLAPALAAARPAEDRCLLVVWLDGGLSHLESFDPKPDAPSDVRGELGAIATRVDGARLASPFERVAARLDRCALLRSLAHNEGNHDRASQFVLTGHRPSPVVEHASFGSLLAARRQDAGATGDGVPPYVAVSTAPPAGGPGFLGAAHAPFALGGDPSRPDFRVRGLGVEDASGRAAVELVDALDAIDGAPRTAAEAARDALVAQARALRENPELQAAFSLRDESQKRRARYGRHRLGQSCLLGLKIAAAGARCVLVHDRRWDDHVDIARAFTQGFPPKGPALDQAIAALLDDLDEHGLGERVTVLVASEFGRTPRLNPAGGRDHWPRAQSALLFGAGVRPGIVGATDARGEEPDGSSCSPADLVATLAVLMGLDPTGSTTTPTVGRPIPLVEDGGRPIAELLA